MRRSTRLVLLTGIVVFGVAIRCYQLTARSIWFDEAFTWRLIQFPWIELLARASQDVHPPLYYLLLKLWAFMFGLSLVSLRTFSITAAALLIALAYGFISSAFRRPRLGLVAALLIAISPWQIALNTEARMYTLAAALSLGMLWALQQRRWVIFSLTAIALTYTHYYGLLVIVATCAWFLGYLLISTRARLGEMLATRTLWYGLGSYAAIALAYLPWLPVLVRQTKQVSQSFWIPPLTRWSLPETLYRMLAGVTAEPHHDSFVSALTTLLPLLMGCVLFVWLLFRKKSRAATMLLVIASAGTFALSILTSMVSQSIYQDRYFLVIHSFLLILLTLGLGSIKPRWLSVVTTSACAAFLLFNTYQHYQRLDLPRHPGVQGAVATIAASARPHDPIIIGSSFIFFPVDHYVSEKYSRPEFCFGCILRPPPRLTTPHLYSESRALSHFAGGPILRPGDSVGPEVFQDPATISLWVVDTSGFGGSNVSVPPEWRKTSEATFPEVFAYQGDIFLKHYSRVR